MATIVERLNKKTGLPSYRVQVRHHSRFLKYTSTDKSLSKTFHTKVEAELYAASVEQQFREKHYKSKELMKSLEGPPPLEDRYYEMMADVQKPIMTDPSHVFFSQAIERYKAEVEVHKALNEAYPIVKTKKSDHEDRLLYGRTEIDRCRCLIRKRLMLPPLIIADKERP